MGFLCSEAFIGIVLGGAITFLVEFAIKMYEAKKEVSLNVSMLLYDLRSIEKYVRQTKDTLLPTANIRYSPEWQSMVSNCTMLDTREIKLLYQIYDLVYDFNYEYENGRKDNFTKVGVTFPCAHKILPDFIVDNPSFEMLCKKLEEKVNVKNNSSFV